MTTPTRIARAIVTAFAVVAIAIPAASAAEPKNGPPFVAPRPAVSVAGEPKNATPFVTATIEQPTPVAAIIAQEQGRHRDPIVFGLTYPEPASVEIVQRPGGFDLGAAGIGGAAALALVLLVAGGAALLHDSRRPAARG